MFFCHEGCGFIPPNSLVSVRKIESSGATAIRWVEVFDAHSFGFCVLYEDDVIKHTLNLLTHIDEEEAANRDFSTFWQLGEQNAKKGCQDCHTVREMKPQPAEEVGIGAVLMRKI